MSRLTELKEKKIRLSNMIIVVLMLIIIALLVFGWYYFRAGHSPVNLSFTNPAEKYAYLYSIYEPEHLKRPMGVATGSDGKIFVTDSVNHNIVVFDPQGKYKYKFGGYGKSKGQFNYPVSVALDGKKVYVADFYNERIQVLDKEGEPLAVLPLSKDREALGGSIMPVALAVDSQSNLYVSDVNRQRIVVFDAKGNYLKAFGAAGSKPGEISYVNGIAIDDDEDRRLYLSDSNNSRVSVFTTDGEFLEIFDQAGGFVNPKGIAFDRDSQRLYVADTLAHVVKGINTDGGLFEVVGSRGTDNGFFNFPSGVWVDRQGRLYVADRENNRVQVFSRKQQ